MRVVLYTFFVLVFRLASSSKLDSFKPPLTSFDYLAGEEDDTQKHQLAVVGSKKCMPDLGCFVITRDFNDPFKRPVNFLPFDRSTINTQFILYTKEHPKEHYILRVKEPDEIKDSPLDPSHRTVFIVHGFFDSRYYGKWMEILKEDLLLYTNYNVIIVDWSKGNGAPYTQATANTRVVGAEIALMIETLKELKGVSPMECHIIGHSLGAHAAGYAGERLKKLGRISGLDPAKPYFEYMPPSVRLDPTDADFVDVIHTDSASLKFFALGMSQAAGHVDFYPNNGMNQPGCTTAAIDSILIEGLIDAARRFVSCNHQRSVDFYTYSINFKKALPVAFACTNWEDYLAGKCSDCGRNSSRCAVLGLKADQYKPHKNDSREVKMYMTTSGIKPFWEFSYQIKIKLRKPKTKYSDDNGQIYLKIQGPKTINEVSLKTKKGSLIHAATYNFLVRRKESLGEIKNVTFSWKTSSWNFLKTHAIYVEYVKITPMNVGDDRQQKQQTKTFCDKTGKATRSEQSSSLVQC